MAFIGLQTFFIQSQYIKVFLMTFMHILNNILYCIVFICSFNPATWGHSPQDIERVKICVT